MPYAYFPYKKLILFRLHQKTGWPACPDTVLVDSLPRSRQTGQTNFPDCRLSGWIELQLFQNLKKLWYSFLQLILCYTVLIMLSPCWYFSGWFDYILQCLPDIETSKKVQPTWKFPGKVLECKFEQRGITLYYISSCRSLVTDVV